MILEMQDFDFVQILSNFPKSNHFCRNFASILAKFRLNVAQIQPIYPNLTNFAKTILLGDAAASPASSALTALSDYHQKLAYTNANLCSRTQISILIC